MFSQAVTASGPRPELFDPRVGTSGPETELWSHYSQCVLPNQFDAWVWFDETQAVTPLPGEQRPGEDEMWPFGL